jgi:hypothetical protein
MDAADFTLIIIMMMIMILVNIESGQQQTK